MCKPPPDPSVQSDPIHPINSERVQPQKMVDGERYIESSRTELDSIKDEEGGSGPQTVWRNPNGPKIIDENLIVIPSDDEN